MPNGLNDFHFRILPRDPVPVVGSKMGILKKKMCSRNGKMKFFVDSSRHTQAFAKMGVRQNGNFAWEKEAVDEDTNSHLVGTGPYTARL